LAQITDTKRPRGRPPSLKAGPNAGSVQSLDRALTLLELIAEEDGLTLSELAQRAGVPPSTAHRILTTFQGHDYVMHDEERGLWLIGVRAFEVGASFVRNRKLAATGRTIMRSLLEASGETVNLGIEEKGSIVFISQMECHHALRAFHRPGSRGAIHASGIGKALLSTFTAGEVKRILHKTGLEKFTEKTLVEPERLFAELAAARARGWAIDDEELTPGMRCIAAPIYNEHGEAFAGLSVSGPAVRITDERIGELGPMVRRAGEDITISIGGRAPG